MLNKTAPGIIAFVLILALATFVSHPWYDGAATMAVDESRLLLQAGVVEAPIEWFMRLKIT